MTSPAPASAFSAALLAEFLGLGVRHVVVSPGSRSQALALAAAAYEDAGALRLHVRIDERGAGFLALGLAIESGLPSIVVTTSGTAVANLHPAVLEAHHSDVPLLLLTADRPEELRGIGSNQTTRQFGLFGEAVRFAREVEAPSETGFEPGYPRELAATAFSAAMGHSGPPGPVQLNLAFREPLSGPLGPLPPVPAAPVAPAGVRERRLPVEGSEGTIVIAGHGAGGAAAEAAEALGVPLVAEVSSGARYGRNLVVPYRELLRDPEFGGRVRRAIVFGHPTLSREVPQLCERPDVELIVVRGASGEDYNPGHRASAFVDGVEPAAAAGSREWLGRWVMAGRALLEEDPLPTSEPRTDDRLAVAEFARTQLDAFREPVTRRMLVRAVWQKTWPHDRLVFGASRLIREADAVVTGKRIRVHANRGLAGIDGTIATATGIALASQDASAASGDAAASAATWSTARPRTASGNAAAGTTRVVLGDLALLHDVGSLYSAPAEHAPRLQLVVGNDGGGSLFDALEVAATADPAAFDRVLYTPQDVRIAALAEAYGWEYRLAANRGELDEALGAASGRCIVEVPLDRE